MGKLGKAIYEHLLTKGKYNKLKIKLDIKNEDYDKKVVELETEKRIHTIRKNIWEKNLIEQENEIIDLKKEIANLKKRKKVKENEKEETC